MKIVCSYNWLEQVPIPMESVLYVRRGVDAFPPPQANEGNAREPSLVYRKRKGGKEKEREVFGIMWVCMTLLSLSRSLSPSLTLYIFFFVCRPSYFA